MTDTAEIDSPVVDRLAALLDAERAALLDGDLDRVDGFLQDKQRLVALLEQEGLGPDALAPLQARLQRNHVLYDHALAGIRRVAARLDALRAIGRSMDTYDATGRRMTIPAPAERTLERRA